MTTEEQVYGKLEELAVTQATIITTVEANAAQDKSEHRVIIQHLERTNGDLAELREDFDTKVEADNAKAVVDAHDRGREQGTLDTIRTIMGLTFAVIAAAASLAGIGFGIARFAG